MTAELLSSRRWTPGGAVHHLVAVYRVVESFKGDLAAATEVIVTDTCLAGKVPMGDSGPLADPRRYCAHGDFSLPGVDSTTGASRPRERPLVLVLDPDVRPGAPELTWLEVPETGFGGCAAPRADPPGLQRLRAFL